MSTPWALTVPASRGLGRAFAGHLLATTQVPVIATARSNTREAKQQIIDSLGDHGLKDNKAREDAASRLEVLELDVTGACSLSFLPTLEFAPLRLAVIAVNC